MSHHIFGPLVSTECQFLLILIILINLPHQNEESDRTATILLVSAPFGLLWDLIFMAEASAF